MGQAVVGVAMPRQFLSRPHRRSIRLRRRQALRERGSRNPTIVIIHELAVALQVTHLDLLRPAVKAWRLTGAFLEISRPCRSNGNARTIGQASLMDQKAAGVSA